MVYAGNCAMYFSYYSTAEYYKTYQVQRPLKTQALNKDTIECTWAYL